MASLTVRNIPDAAKLRFRQIAAAHGRSMEEHLRQLVIDADFDTAGPLPNALAEARQEFRHQPVQAEEDRVNALLKLADGVGTDNPDRRRYADIRFMSAKDAVAELRRLANGADLDLTRRLNPALEAPDF